MIETDVQRDVRADTKERILDVAERLFARHGYAQTSLRRITSEAGVNLAAVNYHFQSKDALVRAVLLRRIKPLNEQRLARLDALESAAGGAPIPIEELLTALLEPVMEMMERESAASSFPKLMARTYVEPGDLFARVIGPLMAPIGERFRPALARSLGTASEIDVAWGLHLTIGAMLHFLGASAMLEFISQGRADVRDTRAALRRLVSYASAGMRALVAKEMHA
jgi:AcrR family transcriptional regulator